MDRPLLAAALIVKDEAEALPACLDSLAGVVDEVHVHDTGSTDGTPAIAARQGAVVSRGEWRGDFSAARTAAQDGWSAEWVLAVDADHRVTADGALLRRVLAEATTDVLLVEIHNAQDTGAYTHWEARLYRPAAVCWQGRVHERLVRPDGSVPPHATVPAAALRVTHLGYATAEARLAKSRRNLALAQQTLAELAAQGPAADPGHTARTLLDLGRSLVGADRHAEAAETLETLRVMFPGTPQWLHGTDFLARLALAGGRDAHCLLLVGELRAAGADPQYCDWLAAQAHAQLGDVAVAARLLAGVEQVVDTAGRRRDPAALRELRDLVAHLHRLVGTGQGRA